MALNAQGILGNFSGKVGNVVGRMADNRTKVSVYQPKVDVPFTGSQKRNFSSFGILVDVLSLFSPLVSSTFKYSKLTKKGTCWSRFISANRNAGVVVVNSDNIEDVTPDYSKLILADGDISFPLDFVYYADDLEFKLSWSNDAPYSTMADDGDRLQVVMHNITDNTYMLRPDAASRDAMSCKLSWPEEWRGKKVFLYAYFVAKNKHCSRNAAIEVGAL